MTEHPFFVDARLTTVPAGRAACASCGVATQPNGSEAQGFFYRSDGHPTRRREIPTVTATFGACPACAARDTAWTSAFGPGWAAVGLACRLLSFEGPPTHALVDAALGGWDQSLPADGAVRRLSWQSWVAAPESEHVDPWSQRPTILSRHQADNDHPQTQYREEPEPEDARLTELRRRAGLVSNIPFGHVSGVVMADLRDLAARRKDLAAHAGELVISHASDAQMTGPHDRRINTGCGACGRSAYSIPYGQDPAAPWTVQTTQLGVIGRGRYEIALCQECCFEEDGAPLQLGDLLVETVLADRVEGWHPPGALTRLSFAGRVAAARLFGHQEPAADVAPWAFMPPGPIVGREQPGVLQRDPVTERAAAQQALDAHRAALGIDNALAQAGQAQRVALAAAELAKVDHATVVEALRIARAAGLRSQGFTR